MTDILVQETVRGPPNWSNNVEPFMGDVMSICRLCEKSKMLKVKTRPHSLGRTLLISQQQI